MKLGKFLRTDAANAYSSKPPSVENTGKDTQGRVIKTGLGHKLTSFLPWHWRIFNRQPVKAPIERDDFYQTKKAKVISSPKDSQENQSVNKTKTTKVASTLKESKIEARENQPVEQEENSSIEDEMSPTLMNIYLDNHYVMVHIKKEGDKYFAPNLLGDDGYNSLNLLAEEIVKKHGSKSKGF